MLSGFCPARFAELLISVVLCCLYTPVKLFECNIAQRRSVVVLFILYKIRNAYAIFVSCSSCVSCASVSTCGACKVYGLNLEVYAGRI